MSGNNTCVGFNGRCSVEAPYVTEAGFRVYNLDFIFNAMAKSLDVVVGMKRGYITGIEKLRSGEYRLCFQWHEAGFFYGSEARDYATIIARQLG